MISRRGLFGSLLQKVREVSEEIVSEASPAETVEAQTPLPAKRARPAFPVHRPPGAVAEDDFLAKCTRCGDCIGACPHQAIVIAGQRMREVAGTPIIVANESPCLHCDGTPCSSVCEPGVLRSDYPQKMGTASISQMDCLAWQRSFCTVCEERCPVPGAITVSAGKPTINPEACTGCGTCLYVCPAPRKAVLLLPERQRPAWTRQEPDVRPES
jgi:ferredoxin-type protein NapG